ncbi:DMT family transporter [Haematomicrobium sanguinis]|uniref:DMT family transporter n=1 Tax=Haematomicrobium sanguinis TaxID=479106 RepID=UPI000AD90F2B|nr:multidrug efflux SMR transporter [Haematomicrobium sanguinis]
MMWLALAGAIIFEVTGTMSLRASEGFKKRAWIIPVVASYVVAFSLLSVVLSLGMPVGIAYGIWAAVGVALTAIIGRLIFKEPLTWIMGIGIVLIGLGVMIVELGSQAH